VRLPGPRSRLSAFHADSNGTTKGDLCLLSSPVYRSFTPRDVSRPSWDCEPSPIQQSRPRRRLKSPYTASFSHRLFPTSTLLCAAPLRMPAFHHKTNRFLSVRNLTHIPYLDPAGLAFFILNPPVSVPTLDAAEEPIPYASPIGHPCLPCRHPRSYPPFESTEETSLGDT